MVFVRWHYRDGVYVRPHYRRTRRRAMIGQGTLLEHLAQERGTTIAALVRDALDRAYPSDALPADVAAERFLAREPIDLGTWDDAKREIEDSLDRGQR